MGLARSLSRLIRSYLPLPSAHLPTFTVRHDLPRARAIIDDDDDDDQNTPVFCRHMPPLLLFAWDIPSIGSIIHPLLLPPLLLLLLRALFYYRYYYYTDDTDDDTMTTDDNDQNTPVFTVIMPASQPASQPSLLFVDLYL
jgi:hypothetical protein